MRTRPSFHVLKSAKRLTLAVVIFHAAVSVAVFSAGRLGLLRGLVNRDGIISAFASDGLLYRGEAALLLRGIEARGFYLWLNAPFQIHVKIYTLLFKALGWCLGQTILSIEPLNALCYAATVMLVYHLGREAFDERAGRLAAALVALWPTFLLHTTQFLKDPLVVAATLAAVAVVTWLLKRELRAREALMAWAAWAVLSALLWHLRREMLLVALAAASLGLALLAARQLKERRRLVVNTACALLLIFTTFATPFVVPYYRTPPQLMKARQSQLKELKEVREVAGDVSGASGEALKTSALPRLETYLTTLRRESAESASSAVDADVEFRSLSDILRYLPRAALVGLFAPFPSMWFAQGGQVGRAGRLLSGAETLAFYALMLAAVFGVWAGRRRPSVYVLLGVALLGATALALVVANVGTLYRMRYPFWMLLVVLGAGGAVHGFDLMRARRRDAREPGADGGFKLRPPVVE